MLHLIKLLLLLGAQRRRPPMIFNQFKKNISSLKIPTIALGACLALFGCIFEDDHDHETGEHVEATGMVIKSSTGTQIAKQSGLTTSDTLVFQIGKTENLKISFLDEDGKELPDSSLEEGVYLAWTIQDSTKLSITNEKFSFSFAATGKGSEGNTKIEFRLMHMGHPDFTSVWFPVKIIPAPISAGKQGILSESKD